MIYINEVITNLSLDDNHNNKHSTASLPADTTKSSTTKATPKRNRNVTASKPKRTVKITNKMSANISTLNDTATTSNTTACTTTTSGVAANVKEKSLVSNVMNVEAFEILYDDDDDHDDHDNDNGTDSGSDEWEEEYDV